VAVRLEEQRSLRQREFDETRAQMEDDTDREVEELKDRYEAKLKLQRGTQSPNHTLTLLHTHSSYQSMT
jgi:hypothetical protein